MEDKLTYRELAERIQNMTDEQKDMTATVYILGEGEYYGVIRVDEADTTDVLDEGHPYLVV